LELLHVKRQEAPPKILKGPTEEELHLMDLSLQIGPSNPFVQLKLIQSVADSMNQTNGGYKCGTHVDLCDNDQAIAWLKERAQ